jgi:hypothetical protein
MKICYFWSKKFHTYLWSWALLEKLPTVQLLKNFPEFCGTQRFITMFTRALHWSLSWARLIQSIPSHPISLKIYINIVQHLCLGLPNGLFPSGLPINILYALFFSPIRDTYPAQLILLDLIILIMFGEEYSYEAPLYAVFSNLPSVHLSSDQIFSSAPCCQTPSVYLPPLMSDTRFRTHTETRAKL